MGDIGIDNVWIKCGSFGFHRAILCRRLRMASQIVSKGDVAIALRRILRADIETVLLQRRLIVIPKRLAVFYAEVSLMAVADGGETLHHGGKSS